MTAGRHRVILRSPSWFGEQATYRKVRAHESEARGWAGTEERQGRTAGLAPELPGRSVWRGGPAPITVDAGGNGHTRAPPAPPRLSPSEGKRAELR